MHFNTTHATNQICSSNLSECSHVPRHSCLVWFQVCAVHTMHTAHCAPCAHCGVHPLQVSMRWWLYSDFCQVTSTYIGIHWKWSPPHAMAHTQGNTDRKHIKSLWLWAELLEYLNRGLFTWVGFIAGNIERNIHSNLEFPTDLQGHLGSLAVVILLLPKYAIDG